ncbi:MAG: uroporphyrinogen decarboxylase family protein [Planctomycetota bacterium]
MNSQERVKRALRRQLPDRIPRYDGFWSQAHRDIIDQAGAHPDSDIADLFNFDLRMLGVDTSARLDATTVSEDDHTVVSTDRDGATIRALRDEQTTGEHLSFAMTDPDVWRTKFRARYQWSRNRVDFKNLRRRYAFWRKQGRYVAFSALDPFEATWRKCGPVMHMMAYVEHPDWVKDMYAVHTELLEAAWKDLRSEGIECDGAWYWADIAYKTSSLVSPKSYRALLQPYHRRLNELVHRDGGETIFHSDGNLHGLLPDLIEAGFDCLQPMEVKAGMDVRLLKKQFGDRLAFMGNIDARLFQQNDLIALEEEIRSKIEIAKVGGGYMYHSDHSIPPGTTFETYRAAMAMVDKYGGY